MIHDCICLFKGCMNRYNIVAIISPLFYLFRGSPFCLPAHFVY